MKHVEFEQSSLLYSGVPNDNRIQCVLCAREILDFQPHYHGITS